MSFDKIFDLTAGVYFDLTIYWPYTTRNMRDRSITHRQLAKMNFDKIFDLTAGEYF